MNCGNAMVLSSLSGLRQHNCKEVAQLDGGQEGKWLNANRRAHLELSEAQDSRDMLHKASFPDKKTKAQAGQTTVPCPGQDFTLKSSCSSKWLPSSHCFLRTLVVLSRAAAHQGRQERVSGGPYATDSTFAWDLCRESHPTHR